MGTTINCQNNTDKNWIQLSKLGNIPGHPILLLSTYNASLQAQKYILSLSQSSDPLQFYQRRKTHAPNLVRVYHYQKINHISQCMSIFNWYVVITQRLPFRLLDIPYITKQEGFYILSEAIIGYNILYQAIKKYFFVNSQMIGFDNNGNVRVWFNQIWGMNEPSRLATKQEIMVQQLVLLIQEYVKKLDTNGFGKQFKDNFKIKNKTFSQIINYIHNFTYSNYQAKLTLSEKLKIVANNKMGIRSISQVNDIKGQYRNNQSHDYYSTPKQIYSNNQSQISLRNPINHFNIISPTIVNRRPIRNNKTERQIKRQIHHVVQSHSKHSSLDKIKNNHQLFKVPTQNTQTTINNNNNISRITSPNLIFFNNVPISNHNTTYYQSHQNHSHSFKDKEIKINYIHTPVKNQRPIINQNNINSNKRFHQNQLFSVPQWNRKKQQQTNLKQKMNQSLRNQSFQSRELKEHNSFHSSVKKCNKVQSNNISLIQKQMDIKTPQSKDNEDNYSFEGPTQKYTELFKFYLQSYQGDHNEIQKYQQKKDYCAKQQEENIKQSQRDKLKNQLDIIHQSEGQY